MRRTGTGVEATSRQEVLDASLRLQLVRARFCDEVAAKRPGDAEVFVVRDQHAMKNWFEDQCARSTELVAVTWTRQQSLDAFVPSHRFNQELVASGVRMTSFFDTSEGDPMLTDFLVAAEDMPYHLGYGPIQLKLMDGKRVIVEGPQLGGHRSLLVLHCSEAVNATNQYLRAVRRGSVRAAELRYDETGLTPRQRVIAALLGDGCTDDDIADRLTLSVRTVRYEVARLLDALDVKTRFAAGLRYAERSA